MEQKKVYQYDKNYNLVGEYTGVNEASKITGIDYSNIKKVLEGERPTANGYIFSYIRLTNKSGKAVGSNKLSKRFNFILDNMENQRIEMFTWNKNKVDIGYSDYLDRQVKFLNDIYSNLEEEEAYNEMLTLFKDFMTWFEYDEEIYNNSHQDKNAYKNQYRKHIWSK